MEIKRAVLAENTMSKTKASNSTKHGDIKALFVDVDGILTDGTKLYHSDGTVSKRFHDHDSTGLKLLFQKYKIQVFIISEDQRVNKKWAEHQGLPFYHSTDKLKTLKQVLKEINVYPEDTGYIGDDLRDLNAMKYVGFPISPANACAEVRKLCKDNPQGILLKLCGGNGAVREAIQKILFLKKENNK